MALDLWTLVWVIAATGATLAIAVLVVAWGTPTQDGLALWGWGLAFAAASAPAFALRAAGWPTVSILLSNLAYGSAIALHTLAIARFQRGRARGFPVALVWAPVVLVMIAAGALIDRHAWRNIVGVAVLSYQALFMAWQAWGPGFDGRRERGRLLLMTGSLLLFGALAMRLPMLLSQDYDRVLAVPAAAQARTYAATFVVLLLTTIGYVLMQKERALDLLHAQATHDSLTGLYNRRAVVDDMERMLSRARRSGLPVSVLMIDFDFFKHVNDTFGHHAGDTVLAAGARCIQGRLRLHDVIGRFGGEEFVCLLPDTVLDGARAVAEDVRVAVQRMHVRVQGEDIPVTISIGVHTEYPGEGAEVADSMLAEADQALYAAKQHGRNRVECSERSLREAAAANGRERRAPASRGSRAIGPAEAGSHG